VTASDWVGVVLLVGDAILAVGCLTLAVFLGWWWLLPFALMCGLAGVLVGRELWMDWR
jgi:hypothetical protein